MSGSAVAQAVGFLLAPVISRLFSPEDFGVFGAFGALTGVIAAFVTLDYSQAIMLPKRREDAGQVFILSCLATLGVSFLCLAVCLIVPGWFMGLIKTPSGWLLVLLVLAVLVGGLNASFQAWCVRTKAFRQASASQVVRGFSSNGLQVGLGSLQAGAPGLVLSSVLAEILAGINLLRVVRADLREFVRSVCWERVKALAWEYRDFPAYSATQNTLNAVSAGLPVLLLTYYSGIAVAGAYAFGMRMMSAPMNLVLSALRQVLFQRASQYQHEERPLLPLFFKATAGLFGIGVFPVLILVRWSAELFAWIFGAEWQAAGELSRYIAVWLLFVFCALPAVLFARLIRIQHVVFIFNLIVLGVRAAILTVGGSRVPPEQCLAFFALAGAALNALLILIVGGLLMRAERLPRTSSESGVR